MSTIKDDLFGDATVSGSITAVNGEVSMNISGYRGVAYTLTGTWTATVQAQISTNDGVTWVGVDSYRFSTEAVVISPTANAVYAITELRGANRVRITSTAFTSGTINVAIRATMTDAILNTKYDGVTGSAVPPHASYVGGQAKVSALPTAITDATTSPFLTDKFGRQLVLPYTIRDLTATAYATINAGGSTDALSTEVTLLAGVASTFSDLIFISCANTSSLTVRVDVRDATAGGIVKTMQIPAGDTISQSLTIPLPQNTSAATWTVQGNQTGFSNTTVLVNAQFIQNS